MKTKHLMLLLLLSATSVTMKAQTPPPPDGDDSDPTKGPMNEYGYCESLENDLYANYVKITTSVSWNPSLYNGRNLAICRNGHLTISTNLTFGNTILLVKAGGSLTLNGAHLTNVSLLLEPGATLNMNNGGSIDMNNSYNFSIPQGTLLNLNYGAIY